MTAPASDVTMHSTSSEKEQLRALFEEAMRGVNVTEAVEREITCVGEQLQIAGLSCDLNGLDRVLIVALGKAANPMYAGALKTLSALLPERCRVEAVVVSPEAPTAREDTVFCEGTHPTPNRRSVHAADTVIRILQSVNERTAVLFLVSGGASSMIERPLVPSVSIEDLARFYGQLIDSGLLIEEINILRKHLSAIKGGRLAYLARKACMIWTLILSDVPRGALASVGSGPSIPDSSTRVDCLRILNGLNAREAIPLSIRMFFNSPEFVDTPAPQDPAFPHNISRCVLSSHDLAVAAQAAAIKAGFYTVVDNTCDEWDYIAAARHLLDQAIHLNTLHPRFCLISVGEVSVNINGPSGRGGRNQQFALWCAIELCRQSLNFAVLSAGSDGVDGRSPAAGAVVDGMTSERASQHGLDLQQGLERFDAYSIFHALGDAIITGPTGNNLRDLRIVISD